MIFGIDRLLTPIRRPKTTGAKPTFSDSRQYWMDRYAFGGNSGAGSYGRLARFKAKVLNELVRREKITTVAEMGVGDGAQLALARYPRFVGYDVAPGAIATCKQRFHGDETKRFVLLEPGIVPESAQLGLSLDVVYHLVEDDVFHRYMAGLALLSQAFLAIYSTNHEEPIVPGDPHIRHRSITNWMDQNAPEFALVKQIRNPYLFDPKKRSRTSFADFYIYRRQST